MNRFGAGESWRKEPIGPAQRTSGNRHNVVDAGKRIPNCTRNGSPLRVPSKVMMADQRAGERWARVSDAQLHDLLASSSAGTVVGSIALTQDGAKFSRSRTVSRHGVSSASLGAMYGTGVHGGENSDDLPLFTAEAAGVAAIVAAAAAAAVNAAGSSGGSEKAVSLGRPGAELFSRHRSEAHQATSLGSLATNFLEQYAEGQVVFVEHAAEALGVRKRRIYDIVNVFEALRIVSKGNSKTHYVVHGTSRLHSALQELASLDDDMDTVSGSTAQGNMRISARGNNELCVIDLRGLTQRVVQIFLQASARGEAVAFASLVLKVSTGISSPHDSTQPDAFRSAQRRLYDVLNILSSLDLIFKVDSSLAVGGRCGVRSGCPSSSYRWVTGAKQK